MKMTRRNFGRDRRYPIVNRFRDSGAAPRKPDEPVTRPVGTPRQEAVDF